VDEQIKFVMFTFNYRFIPIFNSTNYEPCTWAALHCKSLVQTAVPLQHFQLENIKENCKSNCFPKKQYEYVRKSLKYFNLLFEISVL